MPIRTFNDAGTERFFRTGQTPRVGWSSIHRVVARKLDQLDAAVGIGDLRAPPGNRLERLVGDRLGFWSIRINDQWRVVFRWSGDGPADVAVVDYH